MSDIFLSYRRQDSADATGRISDHLYREFGKDSIFTDIDNIPLGLGFREHIDKEVSHCEVFIAVIGQGWLDAQDSKNNRGLELTGDFVRFEVETALKRNIPVIPVLVGGATLPTEQQLPETLKALAYRNATQARSDQSFKGDIHRLIQGIKVNIDPPQAFKPQKKIDWRKLDQLELRANTLEEIVRLQKKVDQLIEKYPQEAQLKSIRKRLVEAISSDREKVALAKVVTEKVEAGVDRPLFVFQDTLNIGGKAPAMVVIPTGPFLMGSPELEVDRAVTKAHNMKSG